MVKCNFDILNATEIYKMVYRCNKCGRLIKIQPPTKEEFENMCDLLINMIKQNTKK